MEAWASQRSNGWKPRHEAVEAGGGQRQPCMRQGMLRPHGQWNRRAPGLRLSSLNPRMAMFVQFCLGHHQSPQRPMVVTSVSSHAVAAAIASAIAAAAAAAVAASSSNNNGSIQQQQLRQQCQRMDQLQEQLRQQWQWQQQQQQLSSNNSSCHFSQRLFSWCPWCPETIFRRLGHVGFLFTSDAACIENLL